ncbi:helix-turn-helix transcriptional regulator [Cohnella lubricantis]|nr:helix-turn-helix domain-containing protein [Cohnella lubricantis]MBP2117233.1 DNA-binding XRE family transcriptional regulator [Cohnella lubricantis]
MRKLEISIDLKMLSGKLNQKDIESLSRHLKTLRQVMKWTQDDLAKKVGVSRQTITLIESGKTAPSKTLVLAILGIFIVLAATPIFGVMIKAVLKASGLKKLYEKALDENLDD